MAADAQSAHTVAPRLDGGGARAARQARLEAELAAFSQEHLDNLRRIFGI